MRAAHTGRKGTVTAEDKMEERRRESRRRRLLRNIFSYLNRRNLFKRGRRKDEHRYDSEPDWFDRKENKPGR